MRAVNSPPSAPPLPATPPPGTSLFLVNGLPAVYRSGTLSPLTPPHSLRDHTLTLSPDGKRVVGLVYASPSRQFFTWTHTLSDGTDRVAPIDVPSNVQYAIWSPDAEHFATFVDVEQAENPVYVGDLAGHSWRAAVPGERIWWGLWRQPGEFTFISFVGESQPPVPQAVTVWSWTPPSAPRIAARITITRPSFDWSPDGTRLLYIGVAADNKTPVVKAIGRDDDRTMLESSAIVATRVGCVLAGHDVIFLAANWSPDGTAIAVVGENQPQANYFAAVTTPDAPAVFLAPDSCYVSFIHWTGRGLVIPLYGPECGATGDENRVALVDPLTARARADIVIGRKAFLGLSADGGWIVTARDGETQFVPTAEPDRRVRVPLTGFLGWCCA